MNTTPIAASTPAVFGWSTPAANIDGTIPAPWRVSHADTLVSYLASIGYDNARAYVERDGDRLWVGLRDNRDADAHELALMVLAAHLSAVALRTKAVRRDTGHGRRVCAIHVLDCFPKGARLQA